MHCERCGKRCHVAPHGACPRDCSPTILPRGAWGDVLLLTGLSIGVGLFWIVCYSVPFLVTR
jgi:hypothetical protein